MNRTITGVADRLATNSTRRGFLVMLAKVMLGTVAAAAGVGLASTTAADTLCCFGAGNCGTMGSCPAGTTLQYCWLCCYGGEYIQCCDCYKNGVVNCIATAPTGCPCSGNRLCN